MALPGSAVQGRRRFPVAGGVPAGRMEKFAGGKKRGKLCRSGPQHTTASGLRLCVEAKKQMSYLASCSEYLQARCERARANIQTFGHSREVPTMMPALQMSRSRGLQRSLKLSAKSRTLLRDPKSRGATSTCPVRDSLRGVSCSMSCRQCVQRWVCILVGALAVVRAQDDSRQHQLLIGPQGMRPKGSTCSPACCTRCPRQVSPGSACTVASTSALTEWSNWWMWQAAAQTATHTVRHLVLRQMMVQSLPLLAQLRVDVATSRWLFCSSSKSHAATGSTLMLGCCIDSGLL